MPRTTAKPKPAQTIAQQLGSLIKSARDIMRKDKGLNGDLEKTEQVKAVQSSTAAELDALLPAILDRAFKGEL